MEGLSSARLSDAQEQYFRENGYLFPLPVLDDREVGEYRACLEAFEAAWGERARRILRQKCHLVLTWADALIRHPNILGPVSDLLGPDLLVWSSSFFIKDVGDPGFVSWHQDSTYWGLDNDDTITAWIALSRSYPENGCMRVIPRTQHTDLQKMQRRTDVANVLSSGIEESLVDESQAVDIVLRPGDVSIHHPNLIHGSNANTSSRWRRGLTIRYIPTTTRVIANEPWPSIFLLRGEAVPGINNYPPWPRYVEGRHMPFRGCETFGGGNTDGTRHR